MSYRIDVTRDARREVRALPGHVRAQARQLIRGLAVDPRPARAKELRGKAGIHRIWLAGRWRIAYEIDDETERVRILRVRHKDVIDYESLGDSSEVHEPRAKYVVTQVIEKPRPVALTRHGRGVALMLSVDDYESLFETAQRGALVEALREGQRDFTAGRVLTHDEMRGRWLSEDPEAGE